MGVDQILLVALVASFAAGGITWTAKAGIRKLAKDSKAWDWLLRIIAVVAGAVAGFMLEGYPWGLLLGIGAGSITTTGVWFKKRLARLAQADG